MVSRVRKEQATDGPFHIGDGERAWYYVDRNSVTVVSQIWNGDRYVDTSQTIITKSELKRMLALLDRG